MNRIELTAPCGLDCFNCPLYEGIITEAYKQQVSQYLKIAPEETPCKGCRGEKGYCRFATGKQCATWHCVQDKGVNYCFECNEFPCQLLAPTLQGVQFPHNMKVYNLCRMKLVGVEKWVDEAAEIRTRYFNGRFEVGQGPILEESTYEND